VGYRARYTVCGGGALLLPTPTPQYGDGGEEGGDGEEG